MSIGHRGAWGTPDFGITESLSGLQGLLTGKVNYDPNTGGSQIFKNRNMSVASTPVNFNSARTSASSGQVLGETNTANSSTAPTQNFTSWNGSGVKPSTNTGSGGTGSFTPPQPPSPTPTDNNPGDPFANDINRMFDEAFGELPGRRAGLESTVANARDQQIAGINEQVGFGEQALDQDRQQVETMRSRTLAQLADDLRGSARNLGNVLGARGASVSSGADGINYALSKEFGTNRANVQGQANQQLADIEKTEIGLKQQAQSMINDVKTWANGQLSQIASYFDQLQGNLSDQQRMALLDRLQQIEAQRDQLEQSIANAALSRIQGLNDFKMQLSQSAQFDPRELAMNEINSVFGGQSFDPFASVGGFGGRRDDEPLIG